VQRKALTSGLLISMSIVILFSATAMVRADTYTWEPGGTTDSWHHADNWDCGAVPGEYDRAYVDSGTAQVLTGNAFVEYIRVGAANSTAKVQTTNADIGIGASLIEVGYGASSTGEISIANSDSRLYTYTGGTLKLGLASGASGKVSASNGAYLFGDQATTVYVGHAQGSTGCISIADSDLFSDSGSWDIYLGYAQGSTGEMIQSGSTSDVDLTDSGSLYVGYEGTGTYRHTGGSLGLSGTLYVGYHPRGEGLFCLSGGTMDPTYTYIGYGGTGSNIFEQTGGTNTMFDVYIGYDNSSSPRGTYNQEGGIAEVCWNIFLGYCSGGTGSYSLTGGTLKVDDIEVGDGTGWLDVDAAGTLLPKSANDVDIYNNSGGTFSPGGPGTVLEAGLGGADYMQGSTSVLEIDIDNEPVGFDKVLGGDVFTAGGTLSVRGDRPKEGETFKIVDEFTTLTESSEFAEITVSDFLALGSGDFSATYDYTNDEITIDFLGWTAGDANLDHKVSTGDLAILSGNWNQYVGGDEIDDWEQADFTGDGWVTIGDLSLMSGNWGWELPGSAAVPEPATLCLLAFGGLAVFRPRRQSRCL